MIAKIGRGSNLYGALAYNVAKIEKGKGEILLTNKVIETPSGRYTVSQLAKSFEPYLVANRNTEKHTLHISLNPDPKDEVDDECFIEMAQDYMREMNYEKQPFVVFKHTDIDRTHIHIVSVCVDEDGRKISDRFEKKRSMNICRELEKKYGLLSATEKDSLKNEMIFNPVDYRTGNIKRQIASVVRHLPEYYQFKTWGEYNALLSLFHITVEKVEGEMNSEIKSGLLYFPLNQHGERVGNPFKASLLGKNAGLDTLEMYFIKCKELSTNAKAIEDIKTVIDHAVRSVDNERDFKKLVASQGISTVVRRNETGRVYGITFIDHHSRIVWNGSSLGKYFSANSFNERWIDRIQPDKKLKSWVNSLTDKDFITPEDPHSLFAFLSAGQIPDPFDDHLLEGIGGLLAFENEEDHQEEDFAHRMKNKRKRKR